MEYTFGLATLQFSDKPSLQLINLLSGGYPNASSLKRIKQYYSHLFTSLQSPIDDYFYIPEFGVVHHSQWSQLLPQSFLNYETTITQWCVEHNVSRTFDKWLKAHSVSYLNHVNSFEYKKLLSTLRHSSSDWGKRINTSSGTNRSISNQSLNKSYNKSLQLCKGNSVLPLYNRKEWVGASIMRNHRKQVFKYKVACMICGYEYEVDFGGSTLLMCPNCLKGGYKSLRESYFKKYLEDKGYKVLQSVKTIIKSSSGHPMELDLYLPDLKVAIEFNGYAFHAINGPFPKPFNYHEYKRHECFKLGIKLYQFWESDSDDYIKSVLFSTGTIKDTIDNITFINGDINSIEFSNGYLYMYVTSRATSIQGNNYPAHYLLSKSLSPIPLYQNRDDVFECVNSGVQFDTNIMQSLLDSLNLHYEFNKQLNGVVYDFYLPHHNYGILYVTHTIDADYLLKFRHVSECNGIRYLIIYNGDLLSKPNVVKNLIKSKLALLNRVSVGARKCIVSYVQDGTASQFFKDNHIQGPGHGFTYGLYYEGRLVSAITIRHYPSNTRFAGCWDLNRYASVPDVFVIGGIEKLLFYAENEHSIKTWISYADCTVSNGSLYRRLGWELDGEVPQDYKYLIDGVCVHKYNYRITRFKEDPSLKYVEGYTEQQLADLNGLKRVYDCGKLRFIKHVKS